MSEMKSSLKKIIIGDEGVKEKRPTIKSVQPGDLVVFKYHNWKGDTSVRKAIVKEYGFGETEFHKDPQWFMKAMDVDKLELRDFAIRDITDLKVVHI